MNKIQWKEPKQRHSFNCKAKITNLVSVSGFNEIYTEYQLELIEISPFQIEEVIGPDGQELPEVCSFAPTFNYDNTVAINTYYHGPQAWTGKIKCGMLVDCKWPSGTLFKIPNTNPVKITADHIGKTIWFSLGGDLKMFASDIELEMPTKTTHH